MVLNVQQVLDIKEYADTESDNSKMLLDLIDTISYLSTELHKIEKELNKQYSETEPTEVEFWTYGCKNEIITIYFDRQTRFIKIGEKDINCMKTWVDMDKWSKLTKESQNGEV
jgi:hypothetical protein